MNRWRLALAVDRCLLTVALTTTTMSATMLPSSNPCQAQAVTTYQQPPAPIAQILDARPLPGVSVSPNHEWLLLIERKGLPTIAELSEPELGLAGVRINPKTNGPSRVSPSIGLKLLRVKDRMERPITIKTPDLPRIGSLSWCTDAPRIGFTQTSDDGIALWVAELATGEALRLTEPVLNGVVGSPWSWLAGGERIVTRQVVASRPQPPTANQVPTGPVIQESLGRPAPTRTYQDLLRNSVDESLFDHYFTSQIVLIGLDGSKKPIGAAGVHWRAEPSPDGKYLLVETLHRPYSYLVPLNRFPRTIAVWDLEGKVVAEVADLPLQEEVPISFDAVTTGPRQVDWRGDAPSTLTWVEALDGGDPARDVLKRDRLVAWPSPFTGERLTVLEVDTRLRGVVWGSDSLALVSDYWWKNRRARTWAIQPGQPNPSPRLVFDRSSEDRYNDPGDFVTRVGPLGTSVLLTTNGGKTAYLFGEGASREGDRPFLDRIELATGATNRLWRCEAPFHESPVAILDDSGQSLLTMRESVSEPPNYYLRDLRENRATALTDFSDPAPQLAGIQPELIKYRRADGVELSGKLYLPPGYQPAQGRLPFVLWAYPREFKSASAASQVSGSPYRFTRPSGSSHLFLLTQGYGILDDPAMPIIGEGDKEANDTYVPQLVSSAKAAIDALVQRGVADPDRVAIGGHSYGAFMAANLLAHSNLFKAGIARSGAYNRTLTPFGFQQEERTFWKAREIYMAMSPFTHADTIKAPILLIHGQADNNPGTFPVQTERMYAAIKGNGGTARMVLLPAESHGYLGRESVGHVLWEMVHWLGAYVKAPSSQGAPVPARR